MTWTMTKCLYIVLVHGGSDISGKFGMLDVLRRSDTHRFLIASERVISETADRDKHLESPKGAASIMRANWFSSGSQPRLLGGYCEAASMLIFWTLRPSLAPCNPAATPSIWLIFNSPPSSPSEDEAGHTHHDGSVAVAGQEFIFSRSDHTS